MGWKIANWEGVCYDRTDGGRDDQGVEAQFMKKKNFRTLIVCSMLTLSTTVSADILDYEGTISNISRIIRHHQTFEIDNGSGEKVTSGAKSDKGFCFCKGDLYTLCQGKTEKSLQECILVPV